MIEKINQILLNNAGNKLSPELLNGLSFAIRTAIEESYPPSSEVMEEGEQQQHQEKEHELV